MKSIESHKTCPQCINKNTNDSAKLLKLESALDQKTQEASGYKENARIHESNYRELEVHYYELLKDWEVVLEEKKKLTRELYILKKVNSP